MSDPFGRTYSGGLTVEDLRDAWLMLEQTFPRNRIPQDLIDRLRRDWRRSDQGVRSVLGTLKKMHRGGERGSDKSTLWDLTEAERWYVFTGERRPSEQEQPELPLGVSGGLDGASLAALTAIADLVRELVEIERRRWFAEISTLDLSPAGEAAP